MTRRPTTLLIATSNPHKLEEIRAVFEASCALDPPIRLLSLTDLSQPIPEPVEDGEAFEANALLKARYYAQHAGLPCLADDSGLEVDALGGAPGVYSARYAGVTGPRGVVDPANNLLLMNKLEGVPVERRTARFVCAMACFLDGGHAIMLRGTIEGRILTPDETTDRAHPERGRGRNGFGYDPLFLVPELGKTTAQIPPEHKNAISHRGNAARMMVERLAAL
ncbi:MAG: non-canonical purine NTP pyrophosphatase [Phycisphaera sp.]|nr:non-canonical purine NTP pyrophosphatase [Phycisphaera sp.]